MPEGATAIIVPARLSNAMPSGGSVISKFNQSAKPQANGVVNSMLSSGGLPPFVAMPQSSAQLTDRISNSPTILKDSVNEVTKDDYKQVCIKWIAFQAFKS